MLDILSTLVPVFGLILLGILVERTRRMPSAMAICLNQFVYWIGLPALLFNQLAGMQSGFFPFRFIWGILLSMTLCHILSLVTAKRVLGHENLESAVFAMLSSFPNSAFMGLPVVMLLLPGDNTAILATSLCAVLYTSILLVTESILQMNTHSGERKTGALLSCGCALACNPLLLASALGTIVSMLAVPVPAPLLSMASMLGSTAAPCALFGMGMMLGSQLMSTRGFLPGWFVRQLPVHLLKLFVLPVLTYVCLLFFDISGRILAVGTLISAMPAGIAAYVIAEKHNISAYDTSLNIVASTGLSVITVPITILLLQVSGHI